MACAVGSAVGSAVAQRPQRPPQSPVRVLQVIVYYLQAPTISLERPACGDIIISLPLRRMAMASFLPSRPPTGDATQNKTEEFLSYSMGFDRRLLTVDPHRQRWLVMFSVEMRRGKSRNNEYIKANSQKLSGFLCTTINRKILA